MRIVQIVLPIFSIIFLGFVLRRKGVVKVQWVHPLNAYVYYVALPAIILAGFWEINWRDQLVWSAAGFNALALLAASAVLFLLLRFFKLTGKERAALFSAIIVGNTVYMGFPIVGAALPKAHFAPAIAGLTANLVFGILLSVMAAEFLALRSKNWRAYFRDFALNPLMLAVAAGIIFSLSNFSGPLAELIKKPVSMLGATASPVALFILGGFLHGKFLRHHLPMALLASLGKLLLLPAFFVLAAWMFGLSPQITAVSVLSAGMPTAVTVFVISERYRLEESLAANVILLSTAISIFTLTALLLIFA